jgi:hypothetical protein
MNHRYDLMCVVLALVFILNFCKESADGDDDISNPRVSDSILYTDVIPDMALNYTFDTAADDSGNEIIKGEFNYRLDLNQDSITDFMITGRIWNFICLVFNSFITLLK